MPAVAVPPVSSRTLTGNRATQASSPGTVPSPSTMRAVSATSRVSPSAISAGSAATAIPHWSVSGIATSTRSVPRTQPVPPLPIAIVSAKFSSASTSTSSAIATATGPLFTATQR